VKLILTMSQRSFRSSALAAFIFELRVFEICIFRSSAIAAFIFELRVLRSVRESDKSAVLVKVTSNW